MIPRRCGSVLTRPRWTRRHWLAAVAAGGLLLPLVAGARDVIRYGGDAAFAPFEYLDEHGVPRGFQVDLVADLGRVIDADIVVTLTPWIETEAAFRAGRVDAIAMVNTDERRVWARFTRSHASPAFATYRRPSRSEPQSLPDLAGLRTAVLGSDAMRGTLDTALRGIATEIVPAADAAEALAAVRRGDADVALLPRAYADPLLAGAPNGDLVAGSLNHMLQPYAFAVAPGDTALQSRLQRGLDVLEADGRLSALRARWLASHRAPADRERMASEAAHERRWPWEVAAAAGAALLLAGGVALRRGRHVVLERRRRRGAEAALARAEDLLAQTFTRSVDGMLLVARATGIVRDANEAMASLLAVPLATLIGQPLAALGRHLDTGAMGSLIESFDEQGALDTVPLQVWSDDGDRRDCLVTAETLAVGGVKHVFCIARDVTAELAQNAALRRDFDALAAELAAARRKADAAAAGRDRAEAALDEFTRVVGHDLKSPLNAVHGLVGLLRQRLREGHLDEAFAYNERIGRAASRMHDMIDALGRLARVDQNTLQRHPVDMMRLVRETWILIAAAQPARTVECRIEPLPAAHADPGLVAQVWQNLLENAWKYSAGVAAAKVAIDSYTNERGTWYRVTDNGAGFDRDKAGRLFLPFQRMHAGAEFAGTGVGLSLVRHIIDHHLGDIQVRSTVGVGTVVEFTLDAPRSVA